MALTLLGCKNPIRPDVHIPSDALYWQRAGYTQLVSPVDSPTSADGLLHITTWIKLVGDGKISLGSGLGQAPLLRMPEGADVVRVESHGAGDTPSRQWSVLDVRGTIFGANESEIFYALRPARQLAQGQLWGVRWPRGVPAEQLRADTLIGQIARLSAPPRQAQQAAERAQWINQCARCHEHARGMRVRVTDGFTPHHGTDASGLFSVQSVLQNHGPLEHNRADNRERRWPFADLRCASPTATASAREGRCSDQSTAIAHVRMSEALAARDPHALRVCDSRRWLRAHSDQAVVSAFAQAFGECEGAPSVHNLRTP
ncbi:MAG: hypothetical protein Q8Q09_04375 [Deltaproteobacteria bacterium]|nr:hypothetical protein [Deltaproteobacteria bacterium]